MTATVIPLGDARDTTHTVQTLEVSEGTCNATVDDRRQCDQPGVIAVRNVIEQQRPEEISAYRVTLCADHQSGAASMHSVWVASAIEMQDPDKRDEFLATAGVTH
jgi:hypothetical protein